MSTYLLRMQLTRSPRLSLLPPACFAYTGPHSCAGYPAVSKNSGTGLQSRDYTTVPFYPWPNEPQLIEKQGPGPQWMAAAIHLIHAHTAPVISAAPLWSEYNPYGPRTAPL